ncbi:MAG: ABC transporter permease, partial [Pseudomonadota bacterium]
MITAMAMTREAERGTLENLLAMPAQPFEVMIGKITPYVAVGAVQTAVVLIAAKYIFGTPFAGALWLLVLGVMIFVFANLAVGFTFSTIAQSQMQAMQLTFFFFLPSLLLSGFMFPFRGMPDWAQTIGEALPLTHFLRIVRGVMLKGAGFSDLSAAFLALVAIAAVACFAAMMRYRRTLD